MVHYCVVQVVHAEANALLNKNQAHVTGAVRSRMSPLPGSAHCSAPSLRRHSADSRACTCVTNSRFFENPLVCKSCGVCVCDTEMWPCVRVCMLQRIYVTLFPCNECAKLLIQAGIKEVIFHEVSS